jgi:hypothetical protein
MQGGEAELEARVAGLLRDAGWRTYRQVPILSRCADIVAVLDEDTVLAVEVKLKDWKRALEQARDHLLACDYVAVCLPKAELSDEARARMRQEGVGFIGFDAPNNSLVMDLDGLDRSECWPPAREWVASAIEGRSDG